MKYRSMARQFSVVFFIGLVFLMAVQSVLIVTRAKNATRADYSNFSAKIIEEDSGKISYWNEVLLNDLRIYSDSDVAAEGNDENLISWIQNHVYIRNHLFNYIMYCTPDGVGYMSSGKTITVISMAFFREIMNNNKSSYVSNIEFQADGSVCYYIARPVFDKNNKKIGVIAGAVKLDEIEKMLSELTMGVGGYALLAGSDGVMITRPRGSAKYFDMFYSDKAGYKDFDKVAAEMVKGKIGEGYIYLPNGEKYFVSYHPVKDTPWSAILAIPVKEIDASGDMLGRIIIIISVVIGIIMVAFSSTFLVIALRPLKVVQNSIQEIATGDADLTKQVVIKSKLRSKNEIGLLADGFNQFIKKLQTIISGVKNSKSNLSSVNDNLQSCIENNRLSIGEIISDLNEIELRVDEQSGSVSETAGAVEEISKNIESMEAMIINQSDRVSNASAAVEQMIGNISSVNQSVNNMAESFRELIKKAEDGILMQNNVNERILTIEQQSKILEDANKTISSIASQTNLLAMNAAIEAAHAGEAGRGFAVVADEIRKLSETSTVQSKTIKGELRNISESIEQVVQASTVSTNSLKVMSENINMTDSLVLQIKGAMQEQEEGSSQIIDALKSMNDYTLEVRAASREMTEGNKQIIAEINRLRDSTGLIKSSMNKISDSTQKIKATSDELGESSKVVSSSVEEIGSQIDLFKV